MSGRTGSELSFCFFLFGNNKGKSVIDGGLADAADARPRAIKMITDNMEQPKWLRQRDPYITRYIRIMGAHEDPYINIAPSADFARRYFNENVGIFTQDPEAYWNVNFNEPNVSPTSLQQLNEFWTTLAELMGKAGLRLAGGQFSAEARLWDKWRAFRDALRAFVKYGHKLDLHGYRPYPGGTELDEFLYPWEPLRRTMAAAGETCPEIVAGEWGIDDNLTYGIPSTGYRTVMQNADYAKWLMDGAGRAANVDLMTFWIASSDYEPYMQYNCNIGVPSGKKANPSVWDRVRDGYIIPRRGIVEPGGTPIPQPDPEPEPEPTPDPTGPILKASWNIRWSPELTTASKIITNGADRPIEVVGEQGDWRKIAVWTHKDAIK